MSAVKQHHYLSKLWFQFVVVIVYFIKCDLTLHILIFVLKKNQKITTYSLLTIERLSRAPHTVYWSLSLLPPPHNTLSNEHKVGVVH